MRILTYIVVAIVAVLIISFIGVVIVFSNDGMDREQLLMICSLMSGALTTVVIIYGAIAMSNESREKQYLKFLEEKKKEENDDQSD